MPQTEPGYATPKVTIKKPTWQGFLEPFYKAFDGDDFADDALDLWDDDRGDLDPWEGRSSGVYGGGEVALGVPSKQAVEVPKIVIPTSTNRGDYEADVRAAGRGVDPSRATGGTGNVIDLARSQLGTPYVWGAEGPDGFDCSGLIAWAFQRAGFDIPRTSAEGYQGVFTPVSRDELQPGDVIFYNYGRKGKGKADHIEIYMGDDRQIGTSNVREDLDIDDVDWDNVIGFGRAPGAGGGGVADTAISGGERSKPAGPVLQNTSTVPSSLAGRPDLSMVVADTFSPVEPRFSPEKGARAPRGGPKAQIYKAFMDAGRPDLAKMVRTKAFQTWINAESGWQVDVTSKDFPGHGRNDGLFQIWRGHSFNSNGQVAQMSAYDQARLVARYFGHLTPEKIREYAQQINNDSYKGWG